MGGAAGGTNAGAASAPDAAGAPWPPTRCTAGARQAPAIDRPSTSDRTPRLPMPGRPVMRSPSATFAPCTAGRAVCSPRIDCCSIDTDFTAAAAGITHRHAGGFLGDRRRPTFGFAMDCRRVSRNLRGAASALLVHGCATASYQARPPQPAAPSPNRVAAAEAAVDAARRNGATQFAASAQHLHVAEAELTAGKQALQAQDGERAGWALARAEADADLSQAAARQARQESDARAVEGQLAAARAGRPQAPSSPADPFEEA